MSDKEDTNYHRIAQSIDYINANFKDQPSLDTVAKAIGISPFHFQRLFTEWAGVSPKKFMQFLSIEYAKQILKHKQLTILDAAHEAGLSSASRLHDMFVKIEAMTPGEYKNGGERLSINYCFTESHFGKMIVASTTKGICHMFFCDDENKALSDLKRHFPNAHYRQCVDRFQQDALFLFLNDWKKQDQIKLHLKGTNFQLKIWQALLTIPAGQLTTYGHVAERVGKLKASRAVGTAVGSNPVALLIPCHRVIQSTGNVGGYKWGSSRKSALIGWEASKVEG